MGSDASEERAVTPGHYVRILGRRWRVVLVVAAFVVAAVVGYAETRPVEYVGQADVLVDPTVLDTTSSIGGISSEEMATQVRVSTSEPVLRLTDRALDATELAELNPRELREAVTAQALGESRIIRISARASTAAMAATLAETVADSYLDYRESSTMRRLNEAATPMREERLAATKRIADLTTLLLTQPRPRVRVPLETERRSLLSKVTELNARIAAIRPSESGEAGGQVIEVQNVGGGSSSPTITTGLLALALGLFLGALLAVLRERFDHVVRDEASLREAAGDARVAGVVRRVPPGLAPGELATLVAPTSEASRDIRGLAVQVQRIAGVGSRRKRQGALVMVTADRGGNDGPDGRAAVVRNLAVALATQGRSVVRVDTELDPLLDDSSSPRKGLQDLLDNDDPAPSYLLSTEVENLQQLPPGHAAAFPRSGSRVADAFAGQRLRTVMRQLAATCDLVVVDMSSQTAESAVHLHGDVDVCLLVVGAGRSRAMDVRRNVERIRQSAGTALTAVLVGAQSSRERRGLPRGLRLRRRR